MRLLSGVAVLAAAVAFNLRTNRLARAGWAAAVWS